MGARAATMLMDRIEGKLTGDPVVVRIVPTLVIRESTSLQPRLSSDQLAQSRK
jgi:LacI family transcriptional regulator